MMILAYRTFTEVCRQMVGGRTDFGRTPLDPASKGQYKSNGQES